VTLSNSSLAAVSTHGLAVTSTKLSEGRNEALEDGRNIGGDPEVLAEAI
jgi:hypothetical protein